MAWRQIEDHRNYNVWYCDLATDIASLNAAIKVNDSLLCLETGVAYIVNASGTAVAL